MALWQKPCYYCSSDIKTVGVDRTNNEVGYTVRNVVPCCQACNYAKRTMTKAEYIALCFAVVQTHEKRESGKIDDIMVHPEMEKTSKEKTK